MTIILIGKLIKHMIKSITEFNVIYACKSNETNNNQSYILVYRQDGLKYKNAPKLLVIESQENRTTERSIGRHASCSRHKSGFIESRV
jgi:hypothetical protein